MYYFFTLILFYTIHIKLYLIDILFNLTNLIRSLIYIN